MKDSGTRSGPARGHWWTLTLLLLVAGSAARLLWLDADPYFSAWIGYVTDEGRWVETARNLFLFQDVELYELSRLHLALSPGFQAATYVVFEALDVNYGSARLVPALSGVALLLLVAFGFRPAFHPAALAVGVALLAFEPQFLFLSRVAVPEIPALLFSGSAFWLAVGPGCTPRRALLAGLSAAAAVSMKGTSLFVMPVFGVLMALDTGVEGRARARNAVAYSLGFLAPMLVGVAGAISLGWSLGSVITALLGFLKPLRVGEVVWRLWNADFLLPTGIALLGAWFGSFAGVSRTALATSLVHRVFLFSACWCAWWAVVWLPLEYLPERYIVHLQLPALLCGMAGLSLALDGGVQTLRAHRWWPVRWAQGVWVALPTALLTAPILVALSGADVSRVRVLVATLIIAVAILGAAASFMIERRAFMAGAYVFSPVALASWLATGIPAGRFPTFWPTAANAVEPALAFALAVASGAAAAVAWLAGRRPEGPLPSVRHLAMGSAAVVVTAVAGVALPHLLERRYAIRSESARLARDLAGVEQVYANASASLLIPTRLRNREQWPSDRDVSAAVLFVRPQLGCCLRVPDQLGALSHLATRALPLEWIAGDDRPGFAHVVVLRAAASGDQEQRVGRLVVLDQPGRAFPAEERRDPSSR